MNDPTPITEKELEEMKRLNRDTWGFRCPFCRQTYAWHEDPKFAVTDNIRWCSCGKGEIHPFARPIDDEIFGQLDLLPRCLAEIERLQTELKKTQEDYNTLWKKYEDMHN